MNPTDLTQMNWIAANADWFYLVGAVLFILTLRGLSSPKTAIRGNRFGMAAMAIAVITTFFLAEGPVLWLIIGAMILGALVGMWKAKTVAMTEMPETVALMHSFVGLSAVAIAIAPEALGHVLQGFGRDTGAVVTDLVFNL